MRVTQWVLIGVSFFVSGTCVHAAEGGGLSLAGLSNHGTRLHGRLSLGLRAPTGQLDFASADRGESKVSSLSLMGDYYLGRPSDPGEKVSGFRATSGLIIGQHMGSWGGLSEVSGGNGRFSVEERRNFGLLTTDETRNDSNAMPYLGVGYTGIYVESGLSFSADFGLAARNPGSATTQFGRVLNGTQSLEELLRALRLSPVLQLGVSYSF